MRVKQKFCKDQERTPSLLNRKYIYQKTSRIPKKKILVKCVAQNYKYPKNQQFFKKFGTPEILKELLPLYKGKLKNLLKIFNDTHVVVNN